ncbi:MAG: flagellin FliC [Actinomycetota bacterium]|nr:flagellin FliC [Actinomycetota bacterium]
MALRIQNNVEAFGAHRRLLDSSARMAKSMERLSSGFRINRGGDDAAGLGISERMRAQARGLAQAQRNIQDGISLVQTAEGNLNEVHAMLQRVRELAVQYRNGSLSTTDRTAIQGEVTQLANEVERIGLSAQFNGIKLLGSSTQTVSFQVGSQDGDTIAVTMISLGESVGPSYATLSLTDANDIQQIDDAINAVSSQRAVLGGIQNRLEHSLASAGAYQENLVAAESRIRDVDMASEMVQYTKYSILAQAGQAMLAQANQAPSAVLSLLQ